MDTFTPQQFADKWARAELKERASYQEHFMDLCRLVGHATPAELDPTGEFFTFEAGVKKTGGEQGYADVWYRGHFAIEYKGKGKYDSLDKAYEQLLQYRENLENPPLLIVCDIEHWEIHTNFTGTAPKVILFTNADIATSTRVRRMLRWLFEDPNQFHPGRTVEQVTTEAAEVFRIIADNMRNWQAEPQRIGHFLTKLVFCLFAEDIGLLPTTSSGRGVFSEIVTETRAHPAEFKRYAEDLFAAMREGGSVLLREIPWFNGGLFADVAVEDMQYEALDALARAARLDWSAIEPSIFGTLFERSLDPSKRAQLGAHYTSRADILDIVEPVLMAPLRRAWAAIQAEAAPLRAQYDDALRTSTRAVQARLAGQLNALRERMLDRLREVTVLDPACGSGNFLYVALQLLKNLEKEVITAPLFANLTLAMPEVHPRQLFGIEKDEIAHDLASIVVWIGYLQWLDNNGYTHLMKREPILEPLDNITRMDAILAYDADGTPVEPAWPDADVIVSNPPFLGGKRLRTELGDRYVDDMFRLWDGRVPREADLVTYWYEKARAAIENGAVKRAGLLATNSIRGGANRVVLQRIKETGDIFMAWSDREWILEGAAVRVSMVGFDDGSESEKRLDGQAVATINADLSSTVDITKALRLAENAELAFMGITPTGKFILSGDEARAMLNAKNHGDVFKNQDVLHPYLNGLDITRRSGDRWIVDFTGLELRQAEKYELPMQHVLANVKPFRNQHKTQKLRDNWWLQEAERPGMRRGLSKLSRYIATPRVAKHRLFVWLPIDTLPDCQLIVVIRDDDYFFGVLHSTLHEVWSLRMGTSLEDRPRYTPTTTFETFPFPWPPGQEPVTPRPAQATPEPPLPQNEGGATTDTTAAFLPSLALGEGPGMGGYVTPRPAQAAPEPPLPQNEGGATTDAVADLLPSLILGEGPGMGGYATPRPAQAAPEPPLPQNEGGATTNAAAAFLPSLALGEGPGMGGTGTGGDSADRWDLPPALEHAMMQIARQLRNDPTPSEDRLWQALRRQQIDGRKFRRQMPIGPFVVDFYCSSEQLIVEVDGPIHESQREADRQRQIMLESLGLRFVRVTAAQVEEDLSGVLQIIRAAFEVAPRPAQAAPEPPLPQNEGGATTDAAGFLPSLALGEGPGMGGFAAPRPAQAAPEPPLPQNEGGATTDAVADLLPSLILGEGPGMGGFAAYRAISEAAARLHAERDAWLNPPGAPESRLKDRTLTNLYNALQVFRGQASGRVVPAAGDFAPRLAQLHDALDRAVCDAYGWPHEVLRDEEDILRRLLALNQQRAAGAGG